MNTSHTLIRAAEIWRPNEDNTLLETSAGFYGQARAFGYLSRSLCFGPGEGLPGRAWADKRPILLEDLQSPLFRRAHAAKASDFTCALAIPYLSGSAVAAVLILFASHSQHDIGALELWHCEHSAARALTLQQGAYGAGGAALEANSRHMSFAHGEGLPGATWSKASSQFLQDLAGSGSFARAELASDMGLLRGLGIPLGLTPEHTFVMTLLASGETPIAHRIESWKLNAAGHQLERTYAFSELHSGYATHGTTLPYDAKPSGQPHRSAIAQAWATGLPVLNEDPASELGSPAAASAGIGANALLAMPVLLGDEVVEVLAIYL
ncbi:MAG: GAF domain-containing protein [Rhodoferax sp.]|nr:GAF domain-containing protein [Rhodoferax sp.]